VTESAPLGALQHVATSLGRSGRGFALVGGIAVTVRSEVRFTRDVDLAVSVRDDADAEQLIFALRDLGYVVTATVEHETRERLATARLRGPSGVVCDLLFASSGIEEETIVRATLLEVAQGVTVPVARVEELLAMKVLASTKRRPLDELDFVRLVEFNPGFDEAAVRANLALITQRGYSRGEDLTAKLEACLARAREVLEG
jgi:hypothetical protein